MNKDTKKAQRRANYLKNKDKIKKQCKEWFNSNRDKVYQYQKEWRENNKEHCLAEARKRYHKIMLDDKKKAKLKEYRRWSRISRNYGLSKEQFEHMLAEQKNCCAICSDPFVAIPNIDHNHITEKVRGLLCDDCNTMLGFARDDKKTLENAIVYLNKHDGEGDLETLYGTGDILDRMFVVMHKIEHQQNLGKPYRKEAQDLKLIEKYLIKRHGSDFVSGVEGLFKANHSIWSLESDLRKGVEITNEEAGAKSKAIRIINDTQRVEARNKINKLFKTGITEKKVI